MEAPTILRPTTETAPGHGELVAIAAGLAAAWDASQVPAGTNRRWQHLARTASYEALVIAWPQGTGLGLHDHGGSSAAVQVVAGELHEEYVGADGRQISRLLGSGAIVELPGDHVHAVLNHGRTEAVSIHVYSPPLSDDSFRTGAEILPDASSTVGC
ncbi:MAG: hypothetical protein JWM34_3183 [Ilumatobacteraceae bacterium]|nr:hypothetical protein [Ilumatobacteraceae bacterium]